MIHLTNHPPRLLLRSLLCLAGFASLGVPADPAQGQAAPAATVAPAAAATRPARAVRGPDIPDPSKQSNTPPTTLIQGLIRPEVALLAQPDLEVKPTPRAKLVAGAATAATPSTASPNYEKAYADELNAALAPLFGSADARVRLNAAIVAGQAAARMNKPDNLAPSIQKAMADKSEAAALWGVKGAAAIVPAQLENRDTKMADAMVRTVQTFPLSAPIVEETYGTFTGPGVAGQGAKPERRTNVLRPLTSLIRARAAMYQKVDPLKITPAGDLEDMPGNPLADMMGASFIAGAWNAQTPAATKQQMAGAMFDLAREMSRLAPALPPRGAGDPGGVARKDDLVSVMKTVGAAFVVIGGRRENKPAVQKAADAVNKANANMDEDALKTRVDALEQELKGADLLPAAAPAAPVGAPAAPAGRPAAAPVSASQRGL